MNEARLARVMEKMKEYHLEQMLVSDPPTIFYLTGQWFHPGERMLALLVRTDGRHRLFLNRLFPARECGIPLVWLTDSDDGPALVAEYLDAQKTLGIDKNWPSRFLLRLMELSAAAGYCNASPCCDLVRAVKDAAELELLRISSKTNDSCMAAAAQAIRPGITERELADYILKCYQEHGAGDGVSFPPIVAFGEHGADPHHGNDDTPLTPGQSVLIDMGCIQDNYCSDMTRTFFTAPPTPEHRRVYELVRRANEAAEAIIRPGVRLCDIDKAARDIITQGGYGPQFNHRLGHFIGLEDHEYGDVSSANTNTVEPGMVFSIEPGIYLPGDFGVRIEDLVIVTQDGCEVINRYPKELTVLSL